MMAQTEGKKQFFELLTVGVLGRDQGARIGVMEPLVKVDCIWQVVKLCAEVFIVAFTT